MKVDLELEVDAALYDPGPGSGRLSAQHEGMTIWDPMWPPGGGVELEASSYAINCKAGARSMRDEIWGGRLIFEACFA